ncbi:ABC transporter substrate-binding protein [Frigidibacter sp. MR17.24]|uniref:ABC transporter substrate-binding protein n=1 Tax=Frigidibacter sp. MR17.24 TaxID=3127345 RepID=UPI003012A61B
MRLRAVLIRLAAGLGLGLGLAMAGPAAAQDAVFTYGNPRLGERLVVRSTTDAEVLGPVMQDFVTANPDISIVYEQWLTNELYETARADCARRAAGGLRPGASVLISSGAHQLVDLVNRGCAETATGARAEGLPEALHWRDELWGITREPAVMVYNRALVPPEEIPHTRFDLLDLLRRDGARYHGRVATYDIEASGLGYLFAFADSQQATTFGSLLEALGRARAVATCCSAEIIDGVAQGRWLIAYNVLGSYAQWRAAQDPRLGVIAPRDYTLVLSRAFMIPKDATAAPAAKRLLAFLLSPEGQLALRRRALIVDAADMPDSDTADASGQSQLRPIGLRLPLLLALDAQARERFIDRWRETFPPAAP